MASYVIEKDKLKGEYKEAFERVEAYSMLRGVDSQTEEDLLMNLVDTMLMAQTEQKPVEKIVGKDIEYFCKEYFADYKGIVYKAKTFPNWLYRICFWLFLFCVLEITFPVDEEFNIMTAALEVDGYLCGIFSGVISSMIFMWIGRAVLFRLKKVNITAMSVILWIMLVIFLIGTTTLMGGKTIEVPLLQTTLVTGIYVFVYKGIQLARRYKKYGTFKKPPKDGSIKEIFEESYKNAVKVELPVELKKRYIKQNKKRRKKGKTEMTPEEYMLYLRKENQNLKISDGLILAFYIVLWAGAILVVSMTSDGLNIVVLAVILGIALIFLYKVGLNGGKAFKEREELLNKCEEEGITIIECAERTEQEKEKI